jgi:TetR/AcrR family transcriptional regulator
MSKAMPQADPARETSRERILRVAARLYALRGYEGTSMREIAEGAGVTKPLVYYHFGSKEQLFSSLMREAIDTWRATVVEVLGREASAAERLRDLLRIQFAHAREAPEIVAFVHEVMSMPGLLPFGFDYKSEGRQLCEGSVSLIEEGQLRGEFRPLDPHTVVNIPIAIVGMYVSAVLAGHIEAVPEGVEDTLCELILHGLEVKS